MKEYTGHYQVATEYNKKQEQLELLVSTEKFISTCILKDEWEENYKIDSLIGWFNHILKKIDKCTT